LNRSNTEIVALRARWPRQTIVTSLQASIGELKAVQKAASEKKPEAK